MNDSKNILNITETEFRITDDKANLKAIFYSAPLAIWYMLERPVDCYLCEQGENGTYQLWRATEKSRGTGVLELVKAF